MKLKQHRIVGFSSIKNPELDLPLVFPCCANILIFTPIAIVIAHNHYSSAEGLALQKHNKRQHLPKSFLVQMG